MTSPAQHAANRRNAEKSTGPRTEDGKKRSAMNAIKHGGYTLQYDPIAATILEENHDAVQTLMEALIEDLEPTTPMEYVLAQSVAHKIVGQQRVDRLASPLASSLELDQVTRDTLEGGSRGVLLFWQRIANALEALEGRADQEIQSEQLAREFHRRVPTSKPLKSRYSDDSVREPATEREWDAKLASMIRGLVGDGDIGVNMLVEFQGLAWEDVLRQERTAAGIEARMLLDQFRDLTNVQDRVQRSVSHQLKIYWDVKDRNARNEPNPDT